VTIEEVVRDATINTVAVATMTAVPGVVMMATTDGRTGLGTDLEAGLETLVVTVGGNEIEDKAQ